MTQFFSVARDAFGNAIPEATVTVFNAGTETTISIFTDNAQTLAKQNPFTADDTGFFNFFTDPGNVKIRLEKSGLPTTEVDFVPIPVISISDSQVGGRLELMGNQSIGSGGSTQVIFNFVDWNDGNVAQLTGSKLVAPVDGVWTVTGGLQWAANVTGTRFVQFVNGVAPSAEDKRSASSAGETGQVIAETMRLGPSLPEDTVTMSVLQDSGGNLDILDGAWLAMALHYPL